MLLKVLPPAAPLRDLPFRDLPLRDLPNNGKTYHMVYDLLRLCNLWVPAALRDQKSIRTSRTVAAEDEQHCGRRDLHQIL